MGLVERSLVLEEAATLLGRAGLGSGGVLVVAGPAGSGRTAVAEEAANQAREGAHVAFVTAAAHLVTGDTNGTSDVFVRDEATDLGG